MKRNLVFLTLTLGWLATAPACTNFLFTRGTTTDGSTFITYAADSHTRYGQLRYHAAADHRPGEMLRIYDYGSQRYLLSIPQPAHTYNVVGFINEHQLAIGETTFGGRSHPGPSNVAGIDYGSLIYVTLQRARNCREAIRVMADLVATYGYSSDGETFSLCDPHEVWIYEIVSKEDEKGAVWVARRVPDGYVSGHANQSRITTFPQMARRSYRSIDSDHLQHLERPEVECVYSADAVAYAKRRGWYSGRPDDFSFADAFNPITFSGARACDARVYAMFRRVADSMERYERYAMGDVQAERLPLWVRPSRKVDVREVMALMRDHFEGTPMDMTQDVGAGPFHCPYRWRPMDFEVNGQKYVHERATSTQQTGFSFVAQCRSWLPNAVGGVLWFGVDDTYSSVYCPMYCGLTQVPECFREGNGSMSEYSETAAFWLFNRVSNFCYLRYDAMIRDVQRVQSELESQFVEADARVVAQWATRDDQPRLVSALNHESSRMADDMMRRWRQLDHLLLMKYIDGNIKHETDGRIETTETGVVRFPQQPPYPDWFYRAIVDDHGETLRVR